MEVPPNGDPSSRGRCTTVSGGYTGLQATQSGVVLPPEVSQLVIVGATCGNTNSSRWVRCGARAKYYCEFE